MSHEEEVNVIVGGGLTGLTTGYILARNGEKCLLLEKDDKVGGLTQSVNFKGCIFDLGPHVLYWDDPTSAAALVKNLMAENEYVINEWSLEFLMHGKYYGFPLRPIDCIRLPLSHSLSFLKAAISTSPTNKSFKQSIIAHTGIKMYESFFSHYVNKKIGSLDGGENLHEDWWRRAKRDYRNQVMRGKFADETDKRKGHLAKSFTIIVNKFLGALNPQKKMFYPRKGIEVVPTKLWESYTQAGGRTMLNVNDLKLIASNEKIEKVVIRNKEYSVKNLVWTADIHQLCRFLSVESEGLQYVNSGVVFIVLNKKKKWRTVSCSYYPQPDVLFSRVYYPSHFCEETVSEGRDALCVEFVVTNEVAGWSSEEIIEKTKVDLQKLGLCEIDEIEAAEYRELKHAYPIYPLDYESRLKKIYGQLRNYRNLYPIGRSGAFYFCLMYDAVNQGIETAEHILSIKGES